MLALSIVDFDKQLTLINFFKVIQWLLKKCVLFQTCLVF